VDADSAVVEFLARYAADRAAGRERPLAEYLAMFPTREREIAAEYLSLTGGEEERGDAPEDDGEERVGPYRLVGELGRGGQGVVWLAEDPRLGRRVALKVTSALLAGQVGARLRREAQAASQLDDARICAVYDVGADDEAAWIAMRHVQGETMAAAIAADGRPPERAEVLRRVAVAEQLALALHGAHEAGIVHRDVKPGNVMITPEGAPVILDFGLAQQELEGPALTRSGDTLGTPAYMSPEQLRVEGPRVDRRTDVWSLGCALYEWLTLARPFEAPTREGLIRTILEREPPDPRRANRAVDADLAVVLDTALSKELPRRYRTALDLAEDLRRVREGRPVRARPIGSLGRLARWARRKPALAASLAGTLLVLAVGLAASQHLLSRTRETLDEVGRLSDFKVSEALSSDAAELWPAVAAREADFVDWLVRARAVFARRTQHLDALAAARSRPDAASLFLADELAELLPALDRLGAVIADVEHRLDDARALERRTIHELEEAWGAAIERVRTNPHYPGVTLTPQLGLVPLGPDPESSLEEFAHFASGVPALRDGRTGQLAFDADSGVVLVLIPGGLARLGAVPPSPDRPAGSARVDAGAGAWDGPLIDVRLEPFFLSKYEMTQGQWLRHAGANPSHYAEGGAHTVLVHPVESVNWFDCERLVRELALSLPTEAQLQYAHRAGTTSRFYTGDAERSIAAHANVADTAMRGDRPDDGFQRADWNDGFPVHAPVGSFRPNPFGLHDVMGNVSEWARDALLHWSEAPPGAGGEGLSEGRSKSRVVHGGSCFDSLHYVRPSTRIGYGPREAHAIIGLRPSRRLE
jgi:serine/threonine protein kinase/formylglycine-generating enzyme required for sulfatase activity